MEMNIYELIKNRKQYLPEDLVKGYMHQLLKAMDHMHRYARPFCSLSVMN